MANPNNQFVQAVQKKDESASQLLAIGFCHPVVIGGQILTSWQLTRVTATNVEAVTIDDGCMLSWSYNGQRQQAHVPKTNIAFVLHAMK